MALSWRSPIDVALRSSIDVAAMSIGCAVLEDYKTSSSNMHLDGIVLLNTMIIASVCNEYCIIQFRIRSIEKVREI
jgi:hypothetical protein